MAPTHMSNFTLSILYIILGFQLSFFDFSMKMDFVEYGVGISEVSMLVPLILIGWLLKSIPAAISDIYSFRGVDRGVIIASSLLFTGFLFDFITAGFKTIYGYCLCLGVTLFLMSIADVNYDAWLVNRAKKEEERNKGNVQIYNFISRKLGGLLGDSTGPIAWKQYGSGGVYAFLSGTCYIVSLLVLPIYVKHSSGEEARDRHEPAHLSISNILHRVAKTLRNKAFHYLIIITVLQQLVPTPQYAIFFYMVGPLKFNASQMSIINLVSSVVTIVSAVFYKCLYNVSIKVVMLCSGLMIAIGSLLPLLYTSQIPLNQIYYQYGDKGLSFLNHTYNTTNFDEISHLNDTHLMADILGYDVFVIAVVAESINSAFREFKLFPFISIAYMLSDSRSEATTIAVVLTVLNITSGVRSVLSGILTRVFKIDYEHFEQLPTFILFSSCTELILCISMAFCIDNRSVHEVEKDERDVREGEARTSTSHVRLQMASVTTTDDAHIYKMNDQEVAI